MQINTLVALTSLCVWQLWCGLFQINKELKETQGKVENSKAEITRISNELEPMEVREGREACRTVVETMFG